MKRTVIYRGRIIGLSVHEGKIRGRRVRREIIDHPGAAAIVAFDENGDLIMVRQHRYPRGDVLEIPAGTLEKGEDPRACARRELAEETGYKARSLRRLITIYPSIGYNTEAIHCYVASGAKKAGSLHLDEDEIISVRKVPLDRAVAMIRSGRIQDAKTICAIMTYVSGSA